MKIGSLISDCKAFFQHLGCKMFVLLASCVHSPVWYLVRQLQRSGLKGKLCAEEDGEV